MIVVPGPPGFPPVTLPAFSTVHVKLLGVLGVRVNESGTALHTLVPPLVNEGDGLTFTVTIEDVPKQEPTTDVGVTEYRAEATMEWSGFTSD